MISISLCRGLRTASDREGKHVKYQPVVGMSEIVPRRHHSLHTHATRHLIDKRIDAARIQ